MPLTDTQIRNAKPGLKPIKPQKGSNASVVFVETEKPCKIDDTKAACPIFCTGVLVSGMRRHPITFVFFFQRNTLCKSSRLPNRFNRSEDAASASTAHGFDAMHIAASMRRLCKIDRLCWRRLQLRRGNDETRAGFKKCMCQSRLRTDGIASFHLL
jgi:hypothetical protein